jgi:hypothetical protein
MTQEDDGGKLGECAVRTPNEFWIALHELAMATAAEGANGEERKQSILQTFQEMPPVAQQEVYFELVELTRFLPEVRFLVSMPPEEVAHARTA